jgi:hypothetical protein
MPLMGGGVASSNPGAAAAANMATASALSHRVAATLDYINDTLAFKIRSAEPAPPPPPPATLVQVCRPIIPCTSSISNQVCGKHLSTK